MTHIDTPLDPRAQRQHYWFMAAAWRALSAPKLVSPYTLRPTEGAGPHPGAPAERLRDALRDGGLTVSTPAWDAVLASASQMTSGDGALHLHAMFLALLAAFPDMPEDDA